MCRYRYYFFGACKHQQTVLVDFCPDAIPLPKADCGQGTPAKTLTGKEDVQGSGTDVGGAKAGGEEGALCEENTDLPSLCSTTCTRTTNSPGSSFDAGSVSVTAEPCNDCLSLQADNPPHLSHPTASSHDMAGLPLFGGAFRHWMSGGTIAGPEKSTVDAKVHMSMNSKRSVEALQDLGSVPPIPNYRVRQPGIRENTDESCNLPPSNEIMQHLAESCRNHDAQHIGTDDRRMTSYGSTVINHNIQDDDDSTRDAYNSIEAEIDQLKEDVLRLREKADQGRTTPKTEQELASDRFLSMRNAHGHSTATGHIQESAATRLQRQHEATTSENIAPFHGELKAQRLPSPQDFPALNGSRTNSQAVSPTELHSQRLKLSYADAATSGKIEAIQHVFSPNTKTRSDTKASYTTSEEAHSVQATLSRIQTSSTAATQDSVDDKDEDHSVIVSPRSNKADEAGMNRKGTQSTINDKPPKQAPRFAQPTQSFSRRTGKKLCKDSASVSPKSQPGGSPTRSAKSKDANLATDKRATQRQQHRKSLPSDWMSGQTGDRTGVETAARSAHLILTPEKVSSPISMSSPSSVEASQLVNGPQMKANVNNMHSKTRGMQDQSPIRKKASSYMASTSAATQRAIATLGQEKAKKDQARVKPIDFASETVLENQTGVVPSRSNTVSSDTSSVHFILDPAMVDITPSPSKSPKVRRHFADAQSSPSQTKRATACSPSPTASPKIREQSSPRKAKATSPFAERQKQQISPRKESSRTSEFSNFAPLPNVANTTTQRRTSRGHLLKPIVACLDAKGLLNKASSDNALVQSYLKDTHNSSSLNPTAEHATTRRFEASSDTSSKSDSTASAPKVLPPHLRKKREVSQASTSSDVTLRPELQTPSALPESALYASELSLSRPDTRLVMTSAAPSRPNGSPRAGQSRVSSLRATADEFKPMSSPPNECGGFDLQAATEYKPFEEWEQMTPEVRNAIQTLRAFQYGNGGSQTSNTVPPHRSPPRAPYKFTSAPLWANRMARTGVFDPTVQSVNDYGSPNGVQAGQILKPSLSPGKKTVHWMLQDLDGKETPIKFGRAPPPKVSPIFEPSTPTISLSSDDTSPLKTPHSLRGWHIGSTLSPIPYGWAGGDGKEIRFVGYGPHAERDPNSVVNFNFHGRTASYNATVPNGFSEDREEHHYAATVAPKSQRQWAEKLGYPKVPCGKVEITQAVEHCIPFGSQLAGYCHDCMASR